MAAVVLSAPAAASEPIPRHGPAVAVDRVGKGAQRVTEYWTRARMSDAIPLTVEPPEVPVAASASPATGPQGEAIEIPPVAPDGWEPWSTVPAPAAARLRPAGGGQQGSLPYTSFELTDTTTYPNVVHGIVFLKLGRFHYTCSGTVVNSASQSVVITAGHCVHEGGKGGPWATNVIFAPGYQDEFAPFGVWAARRLFTSKGWRKKTRFAYDVGAAAMNPNAAGQTLEGAVGARGIAFNQPREQTYRAYGYPAGPSPPFDGESLWACDATFGIIDPFPEAKGPPQSGIGCNMAGGSSGGGWVVGDQFVTSINSFGYVFFPEVVFGTYFGDVAAQVYGRAAAG